MAAQIRPNRLEVSDRFPMLGFTIRTDGSPQRAEVAVATDPSLFRPDKKAERTGGNFYSSRAGGPLLVPRGEAIYVVPPEVLARFIGQGRLYFGLATMPERNGTAPQVAVMPSEGSPYISLQGLTGRSLKRVRVVPSRQQRAAGYGADGKSALEWAGDAAAPGQEPAAGAMRPAPAAPGGNGHAPAAAPAYDDGFGPLAPPPPPVSASTPAPMALANESFSINWDGVQPINQPTDMSCWATAAAMVLGWRDDASVDPQYIGQVAGRTLQNGLDRDDRRLFAEEVGLIYEAPKSYSIEGFRDMLERCGPLWVSVQRGRGGHVVVVTGMYSDGAPDGSDTYVRITDPWDFGPAPVGTLGPNLRTHNTGSRYILTWDTFVREYQNRSSVSPTGAVNVQILHAGGIGSHVPNRQTAPAGYAMAASRSVARPLANESFSINWDVNLINQPTGNSCWATAAAMVLGWRDHRTVTPEYVAVSQGRTTTTNFYASERQQFAIDIGLAYEEPQSYSLDAFRNLLETCGPLWIGIARSGNGHAIVVTGMYSDGAPDGSDTFVRIADPWDFGPAPTIGTLGPNLGTHNRGSRYILTWESFVREYEDRVTVSPTGAVNVQISHAGSDENGIPYARRYTPNRQTTPRGYAMAASLPAVQVVQSARAFSAASAEQVIARAGEIGPSLVELVTRLLSQGVPAEDLQAFLGPSAPLASAASAAPTLPQGRGVVRALGTERRPARFPPTDEASWWEREVALAALFPASALVAMVRAAANRYNVSIAIGPTANVGFILVGGGGGAGIIFAPDDEIGFYGQFDIRTGLILASASVELQFTIVSGGIESFSGISWATGVEVDLGVSVSAQALFDTSWRFQGVTFGLGVGLGVLPIQVFEAVQATAAQSLALAQAAPAPSNGAPLHQQIRRAVALDEATGAIVPPLFPGAAIERVEGAAGNIRWQLDQLRGFKRPPGVAPGAASCITPTVRLSDWPYVEGSDGPASLPLTVDWEFESGGVGNIRIAAGEARNANSVTLDVHARILDEPVPPGTNGAGISTLKVQIEYRFTAPDGSTPLGITELTLYGDGQLERRSRWQTALVH